MTLLILYTSGYSTEFVRRDRNLEGGMNFLRKPYPTQMLAQAMRAALARESMKSVARNEVAQSHDVL